MKPSEICKCPKDYTWLWGPGDGQVACATDSLERGFGFWSCRNQVFFSWGPAFLISSASAHTQNENRCVKKTSCTLLGKTGLKSTQMETASMVVFMCPFILYGQPNHLNQDAQIWRVRAHPPWKVKANILVNSANRYSQNTWFFIEFIDAGNKLMTKVTNQSISKRKQHLDERPLENSW